MKRTHCAVIAVSFASFLSVAASPSPARTQSGIKFRLIHDSSIILVPVLVDGQGPFEFILDTGADDVILDSSLAQRLQNPPTASADQQTIAGKWAAGRSVAESLQLGDARIQDIPVLLTDLSTVRAAVPAAQGILGQSFLAHFNYLLDYRHTTILFGQGDKISKSIHGEPIRAALSGHRMIVDAMTETAGNISLRLLLDSGASALVLSRGSADAIHLVVDGHRFETTVNAKVALPSGRIGQLILGSRVLRNLPATVSAAQQMQQICDGLLPTSLFKALYINNTQGFVEILDTDRQIH
jgi:predicted aspartyl protease